MPIGKAYTREVAYKTLRTLRTQTLMSLRKNPKSGPKTSLQKSLRQCHREETEERQYSSRETSTLCPNASPECGF